MGMFDFEGWATRNDLKCSDGRIIRKDAFKHNDGKKVPMCWGHQHDDPARVLGHAILENREEGVFAHCKFNDTEQGQVAKKLVKSGDVCALSIYANRLKQNGCDVIHGEICDLSLVLAGANPGAYITSVLQHSDGSDEEAIIYTGEEIELCHSEEDVVEEEPEEEVSESDVLEHEDAPGKTVGDVIDTLDEKQKKAFYYVVAQALEGEEDEDDEEESEESEETIEHSDDSEETVADIIKTFNEEQTKALHFAVAQALEDDGEDEEETDNEEENDMKHNAFENEEVQQGTALTHADEMNIIAMAKQSNVGSFKQAVKIFAEENNALQHADSDGVGVFEDYGVLFPEFELLKKGEPETIYAHDQSWIPAALNKIHKSPYSRIRTRHADARLAELKAKGYQKKGNEKTIMGQIKMIGRETTPQTIYIKDALHRDDVIDITDFSIVDYQWKQMRAVLNETMVLAAMVGDRREEGDPDKISEEHIRPIWTDNEEYTIHQDVDVEAAKTELQGSNTGANFGENYIYAEAIITAALYAREKFKGTGTPDFYCDPHLVNVMLLARDLNGRRIYDSKSDLAKALNCNAIVEVEQFAGLTRVDKSGKTKKLLGLFVNLNDYTFGSTRGGEITKFEDFDMDFNLQKFMLETRLSGSLYKLKSAIALEEPVGAGE